LRRAVWTWHQPLTRMPIDACSPISDLFVWRSSEVWQTFFELIDIPSLFEDGQGSGQVKLVFFDGGGNQIREEKLHLKANCRQTLDISALVGRMHGESGTFAIFHSATPRSVTKLGSFLAERGYVSYCYRAAPLRAYVHGNLDAISQGPDGGLQLLGGTSYLTREYWLQHEFQPGAVYELGVVNPTPLAQRYTCKIISVLSGKINCVRSVNVPSAGIQLVPVAVDELGPSRLVIQSRLVLARPLVFRIQNLKMDVFHG
jgi:hypothetical protein